jgi:hypothetical protein
MARKSPGTVGDEQRKALEAYASGVGRLALSEANR